MFPAVNLVNWTNLPGLTLQVYACRSLMQCWHDRHHNNKKCWSTSDEFFVTCEPEKANIISYPWSGIHCSKFQCRNMIETFQKFKSILNNIYRHTPSVPKRKLSHSYRFCSKRIQFYLVVKLSNVHADLIIFFVKMHAQLIAIIHFSLFMSI